MTATNAMSNATIVAPADIAAWCRNDRRPDRWPLGGAAGDPVALAGLATWLVRPGEHASAAAEILAARRPERLDALAAEWPDDEEALAEPGLRAAWTAALRHLAALGRIDATAGALDGPLSDEATLSGIVEVPSLAPFRWASFCTQVRRRRLPYDELRLFGAVGFVDDTLDATQLAGADPIAFRVLRSRWTDVGGLSSVLAGTDLAAAGPWGLSIWWEAASAVGLDRCEQYMAAALMRRLEADADPSRWWPAVLALCTDWIAP